VTLNTFTPNGELATILNNSNPSAFRRFFRKHLSLRVRQRVVRIVKALTSLHSKLFLTYLLIGVLPLFFFFSSVISTVEEFHYEDLNDDMRHLAVRIATTIASENFLHIDTLQEQFDADIANVSDIFNGARVFIINTDSVVVNDSHAVMIGNTLTSDMVQYALANEPMPAELTDEAEIAFAAPIFVDDEVVGVVYIAVNLDTQWTYFEDLVQFTSMFAKRVAEHVSARNFLFISALQEQFDATIADFSEAIQGTRVLVIDEYGTVVGDSQMAAIGDSVVIPIVMLAFNNEPIEPEIDDHQMVYATPILDADDGVIGVVYITTNLDRIRDISAQFQSSFLNLILGISIVVLVLVWFVARLLVNPLRNIVKTVQVISDGQLSERITVGGNDEFGELRDAFNKMTSQLEKIDTNRQEFVSNVSHELRTPLSAIKVLSDSLLSSEINDIESYKEFMGDISLEVDRLNDIVNELLTLVNLEQDGPVLNVVAFVMNKMVIDIMKRLYPLAEIKGMELLLEEAKQVTIEGDEIKLSLAISNLIENGIKYTPEQGMVKVIIDSDHQHAFITVQDTGIGIDEEDHVKIFTRFYRTDKTRSRDTGGTGLGLSITHKTVLLHHGSIRITSKENEGTSFVVRLPLKHE